MWKQNQNIERKQQDWRKRSGSREKAGHEPLSKDADDEELAGKDPLQTRITTTERSPTTTWVNCNDCSLINLGLVAAAKVQVRLDLQWSSAFI